LLTFVNIGAHRGHRYFLRRGQLNQKKLLFGKHSSAVPDWVGGIFSGSITPLQRQKIENGHQLGTKTQNSQKLPKSIDKSCKYAGRNG
jgi:hypothetical protein